MEFRFAELDALVANRLMTGLVVPRPIAWVVTQDKGGLRNAAPFSFFNALCSWPPVLGIGMQSRADGNPKDTHTNIVETGEFVVNLVPFAAAQEMNRTSAPVPPEVDELDLDELKTLPSTHVAPPRIAVSPVAFECRLREAISLGSTRVLVLGDVITLHVADAAVADPARGHIDAAGLDLIARMHGPGWYLRTTDLFEIPRPDHEGIA